jgi:hypothetical protein
MESVGVAEKSNSSGSIIKSITPNPATDFTTISLNRTAPGLTVSLISLTGQTILSVPVPQGSGKIVLSTSELASGMYLVVVKAEGQVIETQKLSVQ